MFSLMGVSAEQMLIFVCPQLAGKPVGQEGAGHHKGQEHKHQPSPWLLPSSGLAQQ